jgi:hypothetical protein
MKTQWSYFLYTYRTSRDAKDLDQISSEHRSRYLSAYDQSKVTELRDVWAAINALACVDNVRFLVDELPHVII